MAVRRIVTLGAPDDAVLRRSAKKIHRVDQSIRDLVDDLVDTVFPANGVGLAAPQIGVPLRALVTAVDDRVQVILNPEIVKSSDEEIEDTEGCLSIPGLWGPVSRKTQVTVRGLSKTGKPMKIKAEGLEARVFQHEIDHLNGVLFIDRVTDRSRLYRAESVEEEEEFEEQHAAV